VELDSHAALPSGGVEQDTGAFLAADPRGPRSISDLGADPRAALIEADLNAANHEVRTGGCSVSVDVGAVPGGPAPGRTANSAPSADLA
jgi:hypothetical protein